MNFNDYTNYMSSETLMGPNSARVLEELFKKYPLQLEKDDTVLDLGCGKGLTSLVLRIINMLVAISSTLRQLSSHIPALWVFSLN